jgi:hypothetical protein
MSYARSDEWGRGWGPGYCRPGLSFWHPAWIVFMVLGFVFWWPLGLLVLAFTLWGRRMSCWSGYGYEHWQDRMERKMDRFRAKMERFGQSGWHGGWQPSSGNRAFDEYRSETLQRLEEEQREFREFLQRLRMAKDKAEFDEFMAERRNRPASPPPQT